MFRSHFLVGVVAAAALNAPDAAQAQCSLFRYGVPDFDQKRDGLPGDGSMYCVPTSALNWMGYIASHGYPPAMAGVSGPWSGDTNYNLVTSLDALMGAFMNTSATDGTSGNNGLAGLQFYLLIHAPGRFTVSKIYGEISPGDILFHTVLGRLCNLCYGYYKPNENGLIYRDGGHCTTLNGFIDFCGTPTVRIRNPSSSDPLNTQSPFASITSRMRQEVFVSTSFEILSRYRLIDFAVGSTTRRYVDSLYIISPMIALTGSLSTGPAIGILRPFQLTNTSFPEVEEIPIPAGGPVQHLAMSPSQLAALAVAEHPTERARGVWQALLGDGSVRPILTCPSDPTLATYNRFGEIIVYCNGMLHVFDPSADPPEPIRSLDAPAGVGAMTYDDSKDEIVLLLPAAGRLIRIPNMFDGPAIDKPLPAGVEIPGVPCIAINEPEEDYYLVGSGNPTIYQLDLAMDGSDRLLLGSSFSPPGAAEVTGLQVGDDGHIFFITDGTSIVEAMRSAAGGWMIVDDSLFDGMPVTGDLVIARSRTNFMPGVHDGPAFRHVLLDEDAPVVPDCPGDYNADGVRDTADFFEFFAGFFGDPPDADYNLDNMTDTADFFEFFSDFFGPPCV